MTRRKLWAGNQVEDSRGLPSEGKKTYATSIRTARPLPKEVGYHNETG